MLASEAPLNPFMDWFGVDESVIRQTMSGLTARGADIADLYFQHSRKNSLTSEGGIISSTNITIDQGVGLRAVVGDQTGYAFTEDLTLPSMLAAATTASANADRIQASAPQAFNHLATGDLYSLEVPWSDVGANRIEAILEAVDQKARASDPSITDVKLIWEDSDERILIATLDGEIVSDRRPSATLTLVVTARRDNEVQTGYATVAGREGISSFSGERLGTLVDTAVLRTLTQFDARRAPVGDMPVVLAAGSSGVLLHEAIGHSLEADLNRNGTSAYKDMLGERVAESFVSVVDNAQLPGELGALNYDDEGSATGPTTMIKDGVLQSYLHDRLSANQCGVATTGSGRRESYRHAPMPRMSCTYMEDGPHARDEIIAAVENGIVCESYIGGEVQIGAGDFEFSVKNGWLIEQGKVTAPVKDIKIHGNGPETLKRISMLANDREMDAGGWTCGKNGQNVPVSQGVPTILVSEMTVSSDGSA